MPDIVLQENLLVRMQEDICRALEKPEGERRWGMVIDLRKCVGCHACTVSCVAENKLPPGVVYRPVLDQEIGEYPNVTRRFMPRPCYAVRQPPCVPVCPVNATYTRPDGIVAIDYEQCIGCRYCITACPYSARPSILATPTRRTRQPNRNTSCCRTTNMAWNMPACPAATNRPSAMRANVTSACTGWSKVQLPMCVTTCIGIANFSGDLNDPSSLVAAMAAQSNVTGAQRRNRHQTQSSSIWFRGDKPMTTIAAPMPGNEVKRLNWVQ